MPTFHRAPTHRQSEADRQANAHRAVVSQVGVCPAWKCLAWQYTSSYPGTPTPQQTRDNSALRTRLATARHDLQVRFYILSLA